MNARRMLAAGMAAICCAACTANADAETMERWAPMLDALEAGAFCFFITETEIVACVLPTVVLVDSDRRLHCEHGPAFSWLADIREHYWHGVRVPAHVIEAPQTITTAQIDEENNAEVRRVMLERYGAARYLEDSGAAPINQDGHGILYRRDLPDDEPLVMVRVLNSTPEPDGVLSRAEAEATFGKDAVARSLTYASSMGIDTAEPRFKSYLIRVPPTMQTAHEAVAWTFGKTPAAYQPQIET